MIPLDEKTYKSGGSGKLREEFIVPPFSTLDAKQGYWQKRKKVWNTIIHSENGRENNLLGDGLLSLAKQAGLNLPATSIFDPVLCEVLINWFCPLNSSIIDPFAGGSVRGIVSSLLGHNYTGVDLSKKQTEANYKDFETLKNKHLDFFGNPLKTPEWIVGDSAEIDTLTHGKYDFMLSCPPYVDLEVYSNDKRDLSNMPYDKFIDTYENIISKSTNMLQEDSFAVFVVSEVRDKNGVYYSFVSDTIKAFKKAGLTHYNDCVLLNQYATAALRAGRQFRALRKVVKTHQNVLVFLKGNERNAVNKLRPYRYDFEKIFGKE